MCSTLDILIIAHLVPFVKRFGELFSKNSKIFFSLQDLAAPLDTLIIAHSVRFVKRFFTFIFSREVLGSSPRSLLLTLVFYHRMSQKSMGNVAQLWEICGRHICAVCLLTNCWGSWYNKISARAPAHEPTKIPPPFGGGIGLGEQTLGNGEQAGGHI